MFKTLQKTVFSVIFCCLALFGGGCLSIASSPAPRFYTLQAMASDQVAQKFNVSAPVIVGIEPFKIPAYLDRPQMATQSTNSLVTFAEFDRWAEPLQSALSRVVSEDLAAMVPDATVLASPGSMAVPIKYRIAVNVVRLDARLDQDLRLVAQWSLGDAENKKTALIKKAEIVMPVEPRNYAGLAETLSRACAALSAQIAAALAAQDK